MAPTRDQFPPPSTTQVVSGNEPTLAVTSSAPGAVDLRATELEDQGFAARYELDQMIGQGGMGEVHLCRDARIGRRVALKRLRQQDGSGSTPQARARFLREARIQAQLEHPSVVPVYDLGRTPEGGEFFTMKRVRGRTLAEILTDGDTSRRKLLAAFSSVCLAVHYAHARGVLHRDLKPANLMLGDFGEVYVLDWGLAKITGETEAADEKVESLPDGHQTVAGAILGTPGYAAPEVLRGETATVAADVYALGAILFEVLTGERLHPGENVQKLMASTMAGVDARASVRAPHKDVPPELEALCVACTASGPLERPPSARAVHEAVERFLDGDRDLELRRQQAARHAETATQAAERALAAGAPIAERKRALQEVGRALAYDPENRAAAVTLVQLLTTPPADVPPEAAEEIRHAQREELRTAAKLAVFAYSVSLIFIPLIIAVGVRSWKGLFVSATLFAVTAIMTFVLSKGKRPGAMGMLFVLVLSTAAVGSSTMLFGPYILLPTIVAVNIMGFATQERILHAGIIIGVGCLAMIVPAVLDWTHVLPAAYRFAEGIIELFPRGMEFHGRLPEIVLFFGSLATIIGASIYMVHAHRARALAEQRLQLHAWQLRQLIRN